MPDYIQNSTPQTNNVANPISAPVAPPQNKGLKFITIFLAILIVIVIAMLFVPDKYFNKVKKTTTKITPTIAPKITPTPKTLSNLEIAKITLDWLDKQRDERGVYWASTECQIGGSCKSTPSNHSGLSAIWGRFKYYQKTKNNSDLDIIKKDLDLYTNDKVVETIQNNSWNCKLMYDIWLNSDLDQGYKNKLENVCFNSAYPTIDMLTDQNPLGIIQASIVASDYIAKYNFKKNEGDLNTAKEYFNQASKLFQDKKSKDINSLSWGDKCTLGIANLDLYKIDKDNEKILFAKSLLDGNDSIKDHKDLFNKASCILFMKELSEVLKNQDYQDVISEVTQSILNNNFDYLNYRPVIGDGGFISGGVTDKVSKLIRENGLLSGILSSNE